MKKSLFVLSVSFLNLSLLMNNTYTADEIYQFTNNSYDDLAPEINNNGHIAWRTNIDSNYQIFFYNGTDIIKLKDNNFNDLSLELNNSGQVAWHQERNPILDNEAYFYDGTNVTNISNNPNNDDEDVDMNNSGYVVWQLDIASEDVGIPLYDGTGITLLSGNATANWKPQINNNGYVTWYGYLGGIWLYDGVTSIEISTAGFRSHINDHGNVVWYESDGMDTEIFLYNGMDTIQITDNTWDDKYPLISNNGHVVWRTGNSNRTWLYDGVTSIEIGLGGTKHHINNNGQVVWEVDDGSGHEIFLYDGISTIQITDNSYDDHGPKINDDGQIVWYGYDGLDYEIFILSPAPIKFEPGTMFLKETSNIDEVHFNGEREKQLQ